MIDLKGRVVLVTGASRGIGLAITRQFLELGASVLAQYNNNQDELLSLQKNNPDLLFILKANLEDPSEARSLWKEALQCKGRIDSLINNAGIALHSPIEEEGWLSDWERTIHVNLTSVGILCKEALLHFREITGGRIVTISSRAAFRGDTPEYLAYASSKSGLVALTRSIARGFGKENIKAFLIAPGFVQTDMAQDFIDTYGEDMVKKDLALNELTQPKDIAPTVAFLISGLADHATGATIDINAGSYVH